MQRGVDNGVYANLLTGTTVEDSRKSLEFCQLYSTENCQLYCTVGIHPSHSNVFETEDESQLLSQLESIITQGIQLGKAMCMYTIYVRIFICINDAMCV